MQYVYVLTKDGKPLMPTTRFGKVRRMLDNGKAEVKRLVPFTIRLSYEPEPCAAQDICVGIDPGRTNIGIAAVRSDGTCLYQAHVETRNKKIPHLMEKRKQHRQASRRGERLARKRLAIRLGTTMRSFLKRRHLPGCDKDITVKDIINTESRFCNRKRKEEWLTPTATQLLRTHINAVRQVQKILPVTDVSVELNKFAFMALDDPSIRKHREDFQKGSLHGYDGVHDAVSAMQDQTCLLCNKQPIENYHHMLPRHMSGSHTFANIVGLCSGCHDKVHKDKEAKTNLDQLHGKRNKKYGALSVLNQIIPFLMEQLKTAFPEHVYAATGYETKQTREDLRLVKEHDIDAYCIASKAFDCCFTKSEYFPDAYEIVQFRRHDRALIKYQYERVYLYNGKTIAKNRKKRTEQKDPSLEDWYQEQKEEYGEKEAISMCSKLTVKKSFRAYNDKDRTLPGAVFSYDGKRCVMRGQQTNGKYYKAFGYGDHRFPRKECNVTANNAGLVYV